MLVIATFALALSACGPQVQDTSLVLSSDPALRELVADLLPGLAERARMELVRPVRVERRTREELEAYLVFKLDQELPPEEALDLTRTYGFLGLLPDGTDLRELLLAVYTEQVAGFYDPDSTTLFVMDDMPVELLEPVLVHELVHAVQDQTANLDSLTAEERGGDRQAAAQSAIEGHATLVMLEYQLEQMRGQPVDLSEIPDFAQNLGPALEAMRNQYPALASAPAIVQEGLLFPYLKGTPFVQAFWAVQDGRPAPFGPYLPQSTEQILRPERAFGDEVDLPTELEVVPGGGFEVAYQNSLGQMGLIVLLQEHLGDGAADLADGWDGDLFSLVRRPSGEEGLAWASVWDTSGERDRFIDAFSPVLERLVGPATLDPLELDGRPCVILRIGIGGAVPIEVKLEPQR